METSELQGNGPHDSREEEVIDWYQHWMAIPTEELAMQFALKVQSDEAEPSTAMTMAVEAKADEMSDRLLGEHLE
jgi:hypothetical protein